MLREIKTKTQRLFQHNLLYLTETRQIFSNQSFKAGISDSVIIVILEPEKIQPVCSQDQHLCLSENLNPLSGI